MDHLIASRQPRVLVVEDEPLLRLHNADILIDAGFDVLEAGDAHEALHLLETIDGIQVVFTDVDMPGDLDGFALAQRIECRWPRIGVLVTSGRCRPGSGFDAPARSFVPKPFHAAQVLGAIGAVMRAAH